MQGVSKEDIDWHVRHMCIAFGKCRIAVEIAHEELRGRVYMPGKGRFVKEGDRKALSLIAQPGRSRTSGMKKHRCP